jgi:toxin-antitoxin system PIN domain toxin
MMSCDTNILFPAFDKSSAQHEAARSFLAIHARNEKFCLCEQVLMELYGLLRNPVVNRNPLPSPQAVAIIQGLRGNPSWRIVDAGKNRALMNGIWEKAKAPELAYRRIFDLRLAATLRAHGVTDFATRNLKDFQDQGFKRVWNPLTDPANATLA